MARHSALSHLGAESIQTLREAGTLFEKPVMLYLGSQGSS